MASHNVTMELRNTIDPGVVGHVPSIVVLIYSSLSSAEVVVCQDYLGPIKSRARS